MRALVTGGAGFIGSHLCDRLISRGDKVWCVDDMRLGRVENVAHLVGHENFCLKKMDVSRPEMRALFYHVKFDAVFHLAANSDIGQGSRDFRLDLELNLLTTISVLEAMQANSVKRLFFASSSAVFGNGTCPWREDDGPMQPISCYGASKLAAEAYVSVFAHTYGGQALIMRFPNVVGSRATHGVVYDLSNRLSSGGLYVFGDGSQRKPYLHVDDLLDAIMLAWDKQGQERLSVYHAAGEGSTSVREIANIIAGDTPVVYCGSTWPGDVHSYSYDCAKLNSLGWRHKLSSNEAIRRACSEMEPAKCAS